MNTKLLKLLMDDQLSTTCAVSISFIEDFLKSSMLQLNFFTDDKCEGPKTKSITIIFVFGLMPIAD